jgi:GNAT superfamily N-acetyltransferase
MGLTPVPQGEIATIVTSLEMRARPKPAPLPNSPLKLVRWAKADPEAYRTLFRRVGGPWLWFSRLVIDDAKLSAIIHDAEVMLWAVLDPRGIEVGILELDFREAGTCELAYFGLVPELAGQGHGRWLMSHALAAAWRPGVERLWVHTCTLDHPGAVGFYRKAGFTPYATSVETFPDPRVIGIYPEDTAPQIPFLAPDSLR